jgi:F-type H+-transporting ATPase subunit epsilon
VAIPDTLTCQIVRPDRMLFEGPAKSVILITHTGELGVWPGHASEIIALGDGVMRIQLGQELGGATQRVVISGGYAEITGDLVVVLAAHARRIDDIEPDVVFDTRQKAIEHRDSLPENDHNRAYYENKIAWCDLLLEQVGIKPGTDAAPVAPDTPQQAQDQAAAR